jgi:hypothetical protein
VALDLTWAHRTLVPLGDRAAWEARPPVLGLLPPPDPAYRIDTAGTDRFDPSFVSGEADHLALLNLLPPDSAMRYGYSTRSGHLSFSAPARYNTLSQSVTVDQLPSQAVESDHYRFPEAAQRLFRLQAVRSFIATAPVESPGWQPRGSVPFPHPFTAQEATFNPGHLVRVYTEPSATLYRPFNEEFITFATDGAYVAERPDAFPRWRLVPFARYEPDPAKVLETLRTAGVDPATTVVVESPVPEPGRVLTSGRVEPLALTPNRLAFATEADGEGYFVLADTDYPGWRAYVDGRRAPILRANYNFRAVPVPPGSHRVEFRFKPTGFTEALAVAIASALAAFVLARRGMRPPRATPTPPLRSSRPRPRQVRPART